MLKAAREKCEVTYKGKTMGTTADFSVRNTKSKNSMDSCTLSLERK
jgi:hypothetical protein